jgi:Amidase
MLGKLQLTEGAFVSHHPEVTPPRNPWNAEYYPGASSSGSGVATAAGLCYASLGSDTGGSIRFPAAAPNYLDCPLIRDLGAYLVKGASRTAIGQYMGRADGVSGGREANIHFGYLRLGVVGMVSMLPDVMVVAAGALALKLRGEPRCSLPFFVPKTS